MKMVEDRFIYLVNLYINIKDKICFFLNINKKVRLVIFFTNDFIFYEVKSGTYHY